MAAPFDVIVFGPTGVTGREVVRYLDQRATQVGATWAVAGRDRARIDAVLDRLGATPDGVVLADVTDKPSIEAMVERARVVVNLVGPYTQYGEPVHAACARAGVHQLDLTGEIDWVRLMIERYGSTAEASGAAILPCAGFESLPFDLAALLAASTAHRARWVVRDGRRRRRHVFRPGHDGRCHRCRVRGNVRVARRDPAQWPEWAARSACARPDRVETYPRLRPPTASTLRKRGVAGAAVPFTVDQPTGAAPNRWPATRRWRRGVRGRLPLPGGHGHRVHARTDQPARHGACRLRGDGIGSVGRDRRPAAAARVRAGLADALSRIGPAPGTGPRPDTLDDWSYQIDVRATTASGETADVHVEALGHPGYKSTATLVGEAALAVADLATPRAGYVTPATVLGVDNLDRFAHAGARFDVAERT